MYIEEEEEEKLFLKNNGKNTNYKTTEVKFLE